MEALAFLLDLTTGTDGIVNWERLVRRADACGGDAVECDDYDDDNGDR